MSLIIISTPIGNLGDMTLRGIETLRQVDYVVSEDTRKTVFAQAFRDQPNADLLSCFQRTETLPICWIC
jgi:16S rRNA C1402 (ribose-2'-O) methylase RsmI